METIDSPVVELIWSPPIITYESSNYVPLYRMHPGDSGADLTSMVNKRIWPFCRAVIPTGINLEIPDGFEGQVRGKSGLASKGLIVHWGTIDAGYRGEVKVILFNFSFWPKVIKVGDFVAQLVISRIEKIEYKLGKINKNTERGEGGFGSTGGKHEV